MRAIHPLQATRQQPGAMPSRRRRPVRLTAITGAAAISLLLSACAVGPQYAPPPIIAPAAWQAPLPHDGDGQALQRWWSQWNDATLSRLIASAQQSSPGVAQAVARIDQARATQTIAGAAVAPAVSGSASANRGNAGDGLGAVSRAIASAQAAWELDLFGSNRRAREAADARLGARNADWHQARVALAAEVASAYVNLRVGEALLTGYERDAASRAETSRLTALKTSAGFEAPANAALAKASASEAAARLLAQRAEVDLGVKALVALTALPEPELRALLAGGRATVPSAAAPQVASVPASVLSQRPDLAAAERELAALTAEIGAAEADRYPKLSLTGNIGYGVARVAGANVNGATWGFGPSLSLPLFDAGRRTAAVSLAQARYEEALAGYRATAVRAVREVEEALTQLDAARHRAPELLAALGGYQSFEKAAQARLAAGAGSVLELEDARRAVLGAQVAVLALERERLNAAISLYRAVGGGWDQKQVQVSENRP